MYHIYLAIIGLVYVQPVLLDHCGTYETFTNKVLDIEQTNKDGKTELLATRNASTEIECRDICCETDTCSVASFDSSQGNVGECTLYSCTPLEKCAFMKQKHIDSYVIKRSVDNSTGSLAKTSDKTVPSSSTKATASASPSSTAVKSTSSATSTTPSRTTSTTTGATTTKATTHGTTTTTTKQTTSVQAPTSSQQSKTAQDVSSPSNSKEVQNNGSNPDQSPKGELSVNETTTALSSSSKTQLASTKTPVNVTSVDSAANATSTKTPVNITSTVSTSTIGKTIAKANITTQGAKNLTSTVSTSKATTASVASQLNSTTTNDSLTDSNKDNLNLTTTELAKETTAAKTTVTTQKTYSVSNVTMGSKENVSTNDHTGNITAETLNFNNGNDQPQTPHAIAAALIAALSFGIIFFVAVLAVIAKYCFDNWQRRHYSRIDYLINGMYN